MQERFPLNLISHTPKSPITNNMFNIININISTIKTNIKLQTSLPNSKFFTHCWNMTSIPIKTIIYLNLGSLIAFNYIFKSNNMVQSFYKKYMIDDTHGSKRYHTCITSSYAHKGIIHYSLNMSMLVYLDYQNQFSNKPLSNFNFLSLYTLSTLTGSLLSRLFLKTIKFNQGSIGASGGILGLYTNFLHGENDRIALVTIYTIECVGLLASIWKRKPILNIDYSAHVGGLLCGSIWYLFNSSSFDLCKKTKKN